MNAVVIFFSRAGENFINGKYQNIPTGNTEVVARKIADMLNLDTFQLKEVKTYPVTYNETVNRAELEKEHLSKVEYYPIDIKNSEIDTLFLGYPNWWGSYPRVVATFLEDFDTAGITIYPFCTHEGSAFGASLQELKQQCPKATIKCGLPVRGSRAEKSDVAIKNWLLSYK